MGSRGEDASWINADLKDDGNNIFEDHNDGSEDSDNQQELEELLYSSIHYDDSSVHVPGLQDIPTQPITINVRGIEIEKQPPKLGFSAPGLNEPVDVTQACMSYPNNHNQYSSSRTRQRYYETNNCAKAAFKPFITPPSQWVAKPLGMDAPATLQTKPSSVSAFTEKLMTRSLNERVYNPGKCDNAKEITTMNCVAAEKIALKESKRVTIVPDAIEKAAVHLDSPTNVNEVSGVPSADRQTIGQVSKNVPYAGLEDKPEDSGENTSPNDPCLSSRKNHSYQTANDMSFQGQKRVKASVPRSKDAKKKRQEILEAQSSRVVDSMLEEESRSSMDGDQVVHTRASHLRQSGAKSSDGGWSVGMSWQDMSANYSFEVDSVDDESICSFQMREGPTPADSRTNTPDLRENHTCTSRSKSNEKETPESDENNSNQPINLPTMCKSGREADKIEDLDENKSDTDENSVECTRYSMKLREMGEKSDAVNEDSESEAESVVELAVPSKPSPPLVDILSDGDDEMNYAKSNIHTQDCVETFDKDGEVDEIVVLYTKSNNQRVKESHQDDDLIILDVDSSDSLSHENEKDENHSLSTKQNSREQDECMKRSNLENGRLPREKRSKARTSRSFADRLSRLSSQGDLCGTFESVANKSPNPSGEKLPLWLRNPNVAFKHLDHQKIWDQMPSNPQMWQLCPEDIFPSKKNRQSGPKCTNCCQFGHKYAFCPKARKAIMCRMCGKPGHNEPRCPFKMCLSCGERFGIFSPSCSKCRIFQNTACRVCKCKGHSWQKCPDLWRRYHLTTSTENLVRPLGCDMKPPEELWCSNCAQRGHHSHTCNQPRWNSEPISPFIGSYLTPAEEESQALGVISTATLLLLDLDAQILQSQDGDEFLSSLADETNATLRFNSDTPIKKLVIEAFPSVQEKVRYHLLQWLKEKKNITRSGDRNTANSACSENGGKQCSSTDVKQSTDMRTPSPISHKAKIGNLPTKPPDLIKFVEAALNELDQPIQFKGTLVRLKNQTKHKSRNPKRTACRLMNMLLIGKLGYAGGEDHVRALKVELDKLKNHEGDPRIICKNISLHYRPIFSCELRNDLESLVDKAIHDPKAIQVAPNLFSPFLPRDEREVRSYFKNLIKLFIRGLGSSPKHKPSRTTLQNIIVGMDKLHETEVKDKRTAYLNFYSEVLSLSQTLNINIPNLPFPALKKKILVLKSASL